MAPTPKRPIVSVVLWCDGWADATRRTLAGLAPSRQGINEAAYEVHLVERQGETSVASIGADAWPQNARHSVALHDVPAAVIMNHAIRCTAGSHVLVAANAAHLFSSGALWRTLQAVRVAPHGLAVLPTLRLGVASRRDGTGATAQDLQTLLDQVAAPRRPGAVLGIARWADARRASWFAPVKAADAFLLPRDHFEAVGGFDVTVGETPDELPITDLFERATRDTARPVFVLLGEAVFDQRPSGSNTAAPDAARGADGPLAIPDEANGAERPIHFIGSLPRPAQALALASLLATWGERDRTQPSAGYAGVVRALNVDAAPPADPSIPLALVIGMHRSGTSFLARQLCRAGLAVPGTPMGGDPLSNPEGHYEPLEIVAWHNLVLAEHGATWSALRRLDLAASGADHVERLADGLERLLRHLLAAGDHATPRGYVIKDPRMCLFTPVWRHALERIGVTPATLTVLRDPTLVAESLARRDGFSLEFGRLLWARYVRESLSWASRGADVLPIDAADTQGLDAYLRDRTGMEEIGCEPVVARALGVPSDPITALYRTFLATRDVDALRDALDRELAFIDRHPALAARLDRLAGLPDVPIDGRGLPPAART